MQYAAGVEITPEVAHWKVAGNPRDSAINRYFGSEGRLI
jgi:hypothetical protein